MVKRMQVMKETGDRRHFRGVTQLDDVYWGGEVRRKWLSEQVLRILLGELSHEGPQLAHIVVVGRR